jgi:hypothetical protein
LKKRTKKLLLSCAGAAEGRGAGRKSFLLPAGRAAPFFKKEVLALPM